MRYRSFNHRMNIRAFSICLLATALVCLISHPGYAQETFYWTGGHDASTWTDADNWYNPSVSEYPGQDGTDDVVIFDNSNIHTFTNSPSNLAIPDGIKIGELTLSGNYKGESVSLVLNGSLTVNGDVSITGGDSAHESVSLTLGTGASLIITGDLSLTGGSDPDGDVTVNVNSGTLTVGGDITITTNAGTPALDLSAGTLKLNDAQGDDAQKITTDVNLDIDQLQILGNNTDNAGGDGIDLTVTLELGTTTFDINNTDGEMSNLWGGSSGAAVVLRVNDTAACTLEFASDPSIPPYNTLSMTGGAGTLAIDVNHITNSGGTYQIDPGTKMKMTGDYRVIAHATAETKLGSFNLGNYNLDLSGPAAGQGTIELGTIGIPGPGNITCSTAPEKVVFRGDLTSAINLNLPFNVEFSGSGAIVNIDSVADLNNCKCAIDGNLMISGTITLAPTDTDAVLDIGGDLTVTGTLKDSAAGHIELAGNLDATGGTIEALEHTLTFDGTGAQTIAVSANNEFDGLVTIANTSNPVSITAGVLDLDGGLRINAGATLKSGNLNIDVDGDIDLNGTLDLSAMSGGTKLMVAGDLNAGSGTLTPGTESWVEFDGTTNQSVSLCDSANTLANLRVNKAGGTVTFDLSNVTSSDSLGEESVGITGMLDLDGGELAFSNAKLIDVGGDVDIAGGAELDISSGPIELQCGGDWTNAGAFTSGSSSTVIFDGTGDKNVTSGGCAFFNLTVNKSSSITLQDTLDVNGLLCIAKGALKANDQDIHVAGGLTVEADGTFTKGSGDLIFDGTGSQTWTDNATTDQDFGDVLLRDTTTVTLGSDVIVDDLDIGAGTTLDVSTNDYQIKVQNDITLSNTGIFTPRQSKVVLTAAEDGSANIDMGGGNYDAFYDLEINGSGHTFTVSNHDLDVDNDLTITAGTLVSGNNNIDVEGSVTGAGNLDLSGMGAGKELTVAGTSFNVTGTIKAGPNSTLEFDRTADGDVTFITNGAEYRNVKVNLTGAAADNEVSTSGALTVRGNLEISSGGLKLADAAVDIDGGLTIDSSGALDASSLASSTSFTVAGDWTNSGTFTAGSSKVTFKGTTSVALDSGGSAFYDLEINKTASDDGNDNVTLNSNLTVSHNLDVEDGDLFLDDHNLTVNGNTTVKELLSTAGGKLTLGDAASDSISVTGTIEVTDNGGEVETHGGLTIESGGTVQATASGSTLDFDGSVEVKSNGTLSFVSGSTVTFAADLTLDSNSTFTHNGQDITFDGSSELTSGGHTFPGITVSSSHSLTLQDALTLDSGESLTIDGTLITGDNDLVVPGDIGGSGKLDASGQGSGSKVTVGGDFNVAMFTRSTSSTDGLVFNDAGNDNAQSFTTNGNTFGVITVDDSTGTGLVVTVSGAPVATSVVLKNGSLKMGDNNLTVGSLKLTSGDLDIGAATLHVTGITELAGGELSTSGEATLDFDGKFYATAPSTLDLNPLTLLHIGGDFDLTDVTIQISGGAGDLSDLTKDPAVIFDGNTQLTPKDNTTWPNTRIEGTVTQSTYDLEIGTSSTSKDLTLNGGTLKVSVGLIVHGTTTLDSTLTFTGGTSTLYGPLIVGAGDTVNFQGGTVNFLGGITNNGATFTATGGTVNLNATQTIVANTTDVILPTTTIDSTGSGSITITVSGDHALQLGNLTFGGGGMDKITTATTEVHFTGTVDGTNGELEATGAALFHFDGVFSASSPCQFDLNAATRLRIGGDFDLTNVTFAGTSLGDLTANPAVIFDGKTNLTSAGNSWPHVNVNDGDGDLSETVTLKDDFTIAGTKTLDVQAGTFDVRGYTLTVPGDTTIGRDSGNPSAELKSSGTLDFNGDVIVNDTGTLRATGGKVYFQERLLSGVVSTNKGGKVLITEPTVVTAEHLRTWLMSGNGNPDTLGNLVVSQGITLTINATIANNLIKVPGYTTVETATLQLSGVGDLTLAGDLNFNDRSTVENIGTGTLTIMDDLVIIPGAQFRNRGGGKLRFEGTVLNDSKIDITDSSGVTFAKLTNKGTISMINTVEVEGKLLNTGNIYIGDDATAGTLQVGSLDHEGDQTTKGLGSIIFSDNTSNLLIVRGDIRLTGTFDPGKGTVRLTGSGILSDKTGSFYNLEITGGTRTLEADLHVINNLAVGASFTAGTSVSASILNCQDYDVTVEGTAYIASKPAGGSGPATAIMEATGGKHTIGTMIIGDRGTYDSGEHDVTLNVSGTLTNSGILILGSGPVSLGKLTNSGQLTSTSGSLSVRGDFDNSGTFNHNNGTVILTDTDTLTTNGATFYNIIKRGYGTTTKLKGNLTLLGALTVESGTLTAYDGSNWYTITVSGDVSVSGVLNMGNANADLILDPSAGVTQTFDPGTPSSSYWDIIKRGEGTTRLINNPISIGGNLSVEAGTFDMGDQKVTVSGALSTNDTALLTGGSQLIVTSSQTIGSGKTLNFGDCDIVFKGDVTVNGRMTATGGSQTYLGSTGLTINSGGVLDLGTNDITVDIIGTLTNSGIAILGSGPVSAGKVINTGQMTLTSGNLTVGGDFTFSSGVLNHNNGTITFTDTATFDTGGDSIEYNNITLSGHGITVTLADNLKMVGDLNIESGKLNASNNNITVSGDLMVGGNTLTMGTGDLILNPPADTTQTFDPGTSSSSYDDIYKRGDGTTQLINNPLEPAGNLTIEAGTFDMGDQDVTVSNLTIKDTARMTDDTGTLTVNSTFTLDGTLSTTGAATHRFNDTVTINTDGIYDNGTNNVTVYFASSLTNNGTVTLGSGDVEVHGTLTNNNIFTSTSGNLMMVGADFDNSAAGAVFNHNNGTLILAGSISNFKPGTSTYNNITKTGANTSITLPNSIVLNMEGRLYVESGTLTAGSNDTIYAGSVLIGPDGKLDLADSSNSLYVSGDFTNNASSVGFDAGGGTLALTGTGTFTPGPMDAVYDGPFFTKGNVTLATNSTFYYKGANWTNTGTFTAETGSTVKFARTGDQTLTTGGASGVPAMTFYNIETDNDDTITFATNVNINGTFTIAGGATVRDVTPGSVYNFAGGSSVVVNGTWKVTGSPSDHIQLLGPGEGEGGSRWTLQVNSSGQVDLNYVDLRDSELIVHGGSLNGKNAGYTVVSLGNLSPSWGPYDPLPDYDTFPFGDANGDGFVDLFDFNILASVFGTTDPKADFNGDGVVDLFDFGILAENFGKKVGGKAPAAPSQGKDYSGGQLALKLPERLPHRGDIVEVEVVARNAWMKAYGFVLSYDRSLLKLMDVEEGDFLENTLFLFHEGRVLCASRSGPSRGDGVLLKLRFRVIGDGRSREGIALRDIQVVDGKGRLGRLGEIRVPFCTAPHRTRLLASFPNPFNSEVWIPFQLADDAEVRVEIYDISGRVVRVLDLGRLPAGYYVDRSRAAYWDGRSGMGERVASGVYLYRFTAGSYSVIRRMVILK